MELKIEIKEKTEIHYEVRTIEYNVYIAHDLIIFVTNEVALIKRWIPLFQLMSFAELLLKYT